MTLRDALVSITDGNYSGARETITGLIDDPTFSKQDVPTALSIRGLAYLVEGEELDKAVADYTQALDEIDPNLSDRPENIHMTIDALTFRGYASYLMENYQQAREDIEEAIQKSDSVRRPNPPLHAFLGLISDQDGSMDESENHYRKAVEELNGIYPLEKRSWHDWFGAVIGDRKLRQNGVILEQNLYEDAQINLHPQPFKIVAAMSKQYLDQI